MAVPIDRIDHLAITVKDLRASMEFYERVLGARVTGQHELDGDIIVKQIHVGSAMLKLHQKGHPHSLVARHPTPGAIDICFHWLEPIETAVALLAREGVAIEEGPTSRKANDLTAGMSVYFRDPDDNLLELLSTTTER